MQPVENFKTGEREGENRVALFGSFDKNTLGLHAESSLNDEEKQRAFIGRTVISGEEIGFSFVSLSLLFFTDDVNAIASGIDVSRFAIKCLHDNETWM